MKKGILFAALATSVLAYFLVQRRNRKVETSSREPLTKRIGNEEKHLTRVFSKAKQHIIPEAGFETL